MLSTLNIVPYYRHTHIQHTKKRFEDAYITQYESKQLNIDPHNRYIRDERYTKTTTNSFSEANKHTFIGANQVT